MACKMDSEEGVSIMAGAVIDDVLGLIVLAIGNGIIAATLAAKAAGGTASAGVNWGAIGMVAVKAFGRAEHRLHGRGRAVGQERRPVDRPERAAVEKTVLEDSVAEADAAKRPRANHDAGRQFTENGRQLEQRSHHASQLCGENDDADLQHQKHHFLDTRHVEVRIGRNGIPCQGRHGG